MNKLHFLLLITAVANGHSEQELAVDEVNKTSFIYNGKEYFKLPVPYVDDKNIDFVAEAFATAKPIYFKFLCLWHYMTLAKNAYFPHIIELICFDITTLSKKPETKQLIIEINNNLSELGYQARNATAFFYKNKKLISANKLPKQLKVRADEIVVICRKLASQLKQLCACINDIYRQYTTKNSEQLTKYINNGSKVYEDIAKYFEIKISEK